MSTKDKILTKIPVNRGKVILSTIHGSKLYGLNHENSDEDWYFITEKGKARAYQITLEDESKVDYMLIGLQDHALKMMKGTHQAIEAAFSEEAEISESHRAYFKNLRVYSYEIDKTWLRTVKKLSLDADSVKQKRHSIRLAMALEQLRMYGRFNPTLSAEQVKAVKSVADKLDNNQLWVVLSAYLENSKSPN